MLDLQELIKRAQFLFSNAPKRKEVFDLIDGKRTTKEIAMKTGRSLSAVVNDTKKLRDYELVRSKNGITKKRGIFEKIPLIRHVPDSYFKAKSIQSTKNKTRRNITKQRITLLHIPCENEILDICANHEDQIYEFKEPGVRIDNITREIAAFLHTKRGGILFYGVSDDGKIVGSDLRRHELDHRIQNSIRQTLDPRPNIEVKEVSVNGTNVLLIIVPPWDKETIYQNMNDGRYYIRKGADAFTLKPEELKKLFKKEYIV